MRRVVVYNHDHVMQRGVTENVNVNVDVDVNVDVNVNVNVNVIDRLE